MTWYPIAIDLRDTRVLIVGESDEIWHKVHVFEKLGARVWLAADTVPESVASLAQQVRIQWLARSVNVHDVAGCKLVLFGLRDVELAHTLRSATRKAGGLFCAVDQPEVCDFIQVSSVFAGPMTLGISSGGQAPLLAKKMREALELALDDEFAEFASNFAELRASVRHVPLAERRTLLNEALADFQMSIQFKYPRADSLRKRS